MKPVIYHADLPYPVITGLRHNKKQAMQLMSGYSGQYSELSTVCQYAYHKLNCGKNKELYAALQGVFLVETHHLELLGGCIQQLGMDPRYNLYLEHKPISWQAEVINYEKTLKEMLRADIEGEKGAVAYYLQTAKTIENQQLAELMLRLAKDEMLHIKIFSELYQKYFGR